MNNEEIIELAIIINKTDWQYHQSDDYRVFLNGEKQVKQTVEMIQQYEWNEINYNKLLTAFFNITSQSFYSKSVPDGFRRYWTEKLSELTGIITTE